MSASRAAQGWVAPDAPGVDVRLMRTDAEVRMLVEAAASRSPGSVHVCQGVRGNGRVGVAQRELAARRLRQWAVMESVYDVGLRGLAKRREYERVFRRLIGDIDGVLAIGHTTTEWIEARGVTADKVFPFAYFIPQQAGIGESDPLDDGVFRFVFVGRLIELKRLDLLLDALAGVTPAGYELIIVGSGPEEERLKTQCHRLANRLGSVRWLGQLPMQLAQREIADADCLVLPSRYDGWGAVVSEALLAGTPVICSDTCGSAGVVRASGVGGVFRSGDAEALRTLLGAQMIRGTVTETQRMQLAEWARCLASQSGAEYFEKILTHVTAGLPHPTPPWEH